MCGLVSGTNLGRFSIVIISNITFSPSSPLVVLVCIRYTFYNCPTVLGYSVLVFFCHFCVCFSVWGMSVKKPSTSEVWIVSFLSCRLSANKPSKDTLHFCYTVLFISIISFLSLSQNFLFSAYISHLFMHAVYLSIRALAF